MSATVKQVAQYAGVSVATVSKYINGGNLKPEYLARVEKAVRELDYQVNEVARNLKTKKSFLVGVLVPSLGIRFYASIISRIQKILLDKGYTTLLLGYRRNNRIEFRHLDVLLRWHVDGIILFPATNEKQLLEKILRQRIPVVLVDNLIEGIQCDAVVINNYESAFSATEKLISLNHRNIALCRGPYETYTAAERVRGYLDAMRQSGLAPLIEDGNYNLEDAYHATKRLMLAESPPTALLCSNLTMSYGMIRALIELGRRIPEDVSAIAFGEQELDFVLPTPLTRVIPPMDEISRRVAERIVRKIERPDETQTPRVETLRAEIQYTVSIRQI